MAHEWAHGLRPLCRLGGSQGINLAVADKWVDWICLYVIPNIWLVPDAMKWRQDKK